jgi:hypothetical protein
MCVILTFHASFGAIATQQSITLLHHSIELVEKCHPMPSQVQRRRLWLVVDVDDCTIMASWSGVQRSTIVLYQISLNWMRQKAKSFAN